MHYKFPAESADEPIVSLRKTRRGPVNLANLKVQAMFSKSIYALARPQKEDRSAIPSLDHYLHAILAIDQHAIDIDPEAARAFQLGLRSLHGEVTGDHGPAALESSRSKLNELLGTYHDATVTHYQEREADVRDILAVLSAAAESLSLQSGQQHTRLSGFTEQLQSISRAQDLGEIRRNLTQQVLRMRIATDVIRKENQSSVSLMQAQMKHFQERLESAEKLASTDELTELLNRRAGLTQLVSKITKNTPFCLMVLDIDRFKSINDQNGHSVGDQVLRIFGKKLCRLASTSEVVCRWGGDEFIVLIPSTLESALTRAAQMCSDLSGPYNLVMAGREFQLQVTISRGVAEYEAGDDAELLFSRADEVLYTNKKLATRTAR
jgi:diguanylate cyclase (GGDEF)-like protein